jgi:3-phosphoglycerate kinase
MGIRKPFGRPCPPGIEAIVMDIPQLQEAIVSGKRVLVRADFNVPLTPDGTIANDRRIVESLPTINYLLEHGATVILLSHLGRPKGMEKQWSLSPVATRLEQLLNKPVQFWEDYVSDGIEQKVAALAAGSIVLCENIRFHEEEKTNDAAFAQRLAKLGEVFVNDAFGAAHRAHASTVGVTAYLPSYAGLLLSREIELIGNAVTKPERPFLVIIGGGKTPEKIHVINKLLDMADTIYLGGAVANTFFATWGIGVGVSKVDHEMIEMARNILWKATRVPATLLLPSDVVVSNADRTTEPTSMPYDKVPMGQGIFDIGVNSQKELAAIIQKAKTIIWSGPMGLYEDERFATGTRVTGEQIAAANALSIIGGGDTISTIKDETVLKGMDLISTGGSAMLEFIEKGTLPVIEALKNGVKHV